MRTIGAAQLSALQARSGSNHGALIEINLSSGPLRWCTYDGDVVWNGQTWLGKQSVNAVVAPSETTEATATIGKQDLDGAFLAVLRADGWINNKVSVWLVSSGPGVYALEDALELFNGHSERYEDDGTLVSLFCSELGASNQSSPRILTDEICNHIPPVGTRIWTLHGWYVVQRGE